MKKYASTLFILIAVVIGVLGQLSIKQGLNMLGNVDFSGGILSTYVKLLLSPCVFFGGFIYFLSLFIWFYVLSKVDLSFAYPFLALSYVLVLVLSWLVLGESISTLRIAGVLIISGGVILVAMS